MNDITELKDIAAETAVIGSILEHPEFLMHSDWLKAKHFSQEENGSIYWACNELMKKGITEFDSISLNNQLNSNDAVKKVMSSKNLSDIAEYIELSKYAARDQVEAYIDVAKTVFTYAYKRTAYRKTYEIQRECFGNDNLQSLDKKFHEVYVDLTDEFLFDNDIHSVGDVIDDVLTDILSARDGQMSGMPSKLKIFDNFWTYDKGELVVFAARMKSGKSALLMNEAIHKAENGIGTLVIDTELQTKTWILRLISMLTQIPTKRIKRGTALTPDEIDKISSAVNYIKQLNLTHVYMPSPDINKVYSLCKMMQMKKNIEFVIYDYIKADMNDASALSNELGRITTVLKNEIAGDMDLAVLAAVQLNRNNDISSSDKIAMYASTVNYWRFKTGQEMAEDGGIKYGNIYTYVKYNRNGDQQNEEEQMSVLFKGDTMTICDCEQPVREADTPFEISE